MTYDVNALRAHHSDPLSFANQLGIIDGRGSYKRLANGIQARCFVHGDRTPSLSITRTSTGLRFKCFGCDFGGDIFNAIAARHNLDAHRDFHQVATIAAEMAGMRENETREVMLPPPLPPEEPRLSDDGFAALADVIEHECPLRSQPDVCQYLARRGLLEAADGSLWALPGDRKGLERVRDAIVSEVGQEAWMTSGMANESGWWKSERNRLCIPWRGPNRAVLTLQRRLIGDGNPKYVFPVRRAPRYPFGIEDVHEMLGPATEIAWVEGALDVLAMRALAARAGVDRLTLGIPGVESWNKAWAGVCEARVAVVALDADKAGDDHVTEIALDLYAAGAISVDRVRPLSSKDWADLAMREAS